jgi:ubiquinone/menaquinone biosynthesis C-methylase UbiE
MQTVEDFYNAFNFKDMVLGDRGGEPPILLKNFFGQDITYIVETLESGKDVLEVGCGFGRLLPALAKKCKTVTGIDFSDLQLSQAKEGSASLSNVTLLKMNAESLEFADNSFDISLCMNCTLGNMPGIEKQVIQEMIRVTKPGGRVVIRVFADTKEVRAAQYENYKRLKLMKIEDKGTAVVTEEGFYSRRFSETDIRDLFRETKAIPQIRRDCEAGFLIEVVV